MKITQHDLAQVDDQTLKRLVVAAKTDEHGSLTPLWHSFGNALIRAMQERRRSAAWHELEFDETEGSLITDPVD